MRVVPKTGYRGGFSLNGTNSAIEFCAGRFAAQCELQYFTGSTHFTLCICC